MGTRNITRVISNNQLKVCQYCQWDGYPTGAGKDIIDFIRETDDDRMIERLAHVTLVTNAKGNTFATGAPLFREANDIAEDEWEFRQTAFNEWRIMHPDSYGVEEYNYTKRRVNELLTEKYGPELMQMWHISTRDTGYKILPLIYESTNDLTVYSDDYLTENTGDWQIEAIWELDYDTKTLTGTWHAVKRSWTFDELRQMDDAEIESVMEDYEHEGWEE